MILDTRNEDQRANAGDELKTTSKKGMLKNGEQVAGEEKNLLTQYCRCLCDQRVVATTAFLYYNYPKNGHSIYHSLQVKAIFLVLELLQSRLSVRGPE